MAVNSTAWKRFPVADRDQSFNADQAIARLKEYSSGNVSTFNSAFLWRNSNGAANNVDSYRLPVADVINGKLTLIPHAVFTAAAIMSGAHGGLEGVVTEESERNKIKAVITEIYAMLQKAYGDPRTVPPWLKGRTASEREEEARTMKASLGDTFLPALGSDDAVVQASSGNDGFMDVENVDTHTVAAAAGSLNELVNEVDSETASGVQDEHDVVTAAAPLAPPAEWFSNPHLNAPTPIVVTADGRVMGHLAAFGVCHAGISNQCVMAPRSAAGYKYFLNGSVLTADGSLVKVGKITLGTGHADTRLGYQPAADHYDNTGTAVAVVTTGEDAHGIWVAGSLTPETSDAKAAELRRSPLSGDWRRVNGNLELVAALAVNTPGFPIVQLSASGEPMALCAAGVVLEDGSIMASAESEPQEQAPADIRAAERLASVDSVMNKMQVARRQSRLHQLLR